MDNSEGTKPSPWAISFHLKECGHNLSNISGRSCSVSGAVGDGRVYKWHEDIEIKYSLSGCPLREVGNIVT